LNDLRRVKPYRYLEDAMVPPTTLRPAESIAEADALFDEGLALMKRAGHGTPMFYNQDTMKLALAKFKELIDRYPSSDKIDDAAFMIGEIYKEYFEEADNEIAIKWYQRALDWNPNLPYPARFQMAVVYDYRMHEREKALDMYQQVIEHETFNQSNVDFANARIGRLTREETRLAPGDSMPPQNTIPEEPGPADMPGS
jgi:tetratricopeptide (TPR) repeat protein